MTQTQDFVFLILKKRKVGKFLIIELKYNDKDIIYNGG